MRRLAPIVVLLAVAAPAAIALARIGGAPPPRATAIAASGSFEAANSRDGQPIFSATNIAPGGSAAGTVTIEEGGSARAALVLRRGEVIDTPGPGGGVLSNRLRLSVVDITAPASPRLVYSGPLASMPAQTAGVLEGGEARTFEFTASLPEGGEPGFQNAVQGASTMVAYAWAVEEASEGGGERPGTPSRPAGGKEGGDTTARSAFHLIVPRIRRAPRRGHLVVWANCDEPCRLLVRGRIRATVAGHRQGAPVHFRRRLAAAGPRRLLIPIPRKLRRRLRQAPRPKRLRARLRFTAVAADGRRDSVRKRVRLRVGRHQPHPAPPTPGPRSS
jgi:hypothetical protein